VKVEPEANPTPLFPAPPKIRIDVMALVFLQVETAAPVERNMVVALELFPPLCITLLNTEVDE
jgi:hypothetical protein